MALFYDGPKSSLALAEASGLGASLPLLISSLALLLLVSVFCFFTWNEYIKSADQTRVSVAIIAALRDEISWLEQAETCQQAFLLTTDARYLREGTRAIPEAETQLRKLHDLNAKLPRGLSLLPSFDSAVNAKTDDLERTWKLIREQSSAAAIASIKAVRGHLLLDTARDIARKLEQSEQDRLLINRRRSRFYARMAQLVATFGSAGIFTIVLISTIRMQRLIAGRAALTAELQRTNEDLRQFVYSASHDLQEPLRNLMIYSDLVERRIAEGALELLRNDVKSLRLFANRMRALVNDLLAYTQVVSTDAVPPGVADMSKVVAKVVENCRSSIVETDAQITYGPLPALRISEIHAELLMRNLLQNAIQYRKKEVPPSIRISAQKNRSEWIISVEDNGIGIEPRYHSHIFGIFKRLHTATEYPGTGLGLAICRKIVERHRGRIWVESQLDKGSTFYFAIPAVTSEPKS
jgi:signal transduction histidine kinase